jgi:hypothetical protein
MYYTAKIDFARELEAEAIERVATLLATGGASCSHSVDIDNPESIAQQALAPVRSLRVSLLSSALDEARHRGLSAAENYVGGPAANANREGDEAQRIARARCSAVLSQRREALTRGETEKAEEREQRQTERTEDKKERARQRWLDLAIRLGLPVLTLASAYFGYAVAAIVGVVSFAIAIVARKQGDDV